MEDIREEIKNKIRPNRREEITGAVLQGVLLNMVDAMPDIVQDTGQGTGTVMSQKAVTDALAEKQDKTDDSLKTTDKTVAGAVNEIYDNMIVAVEFTEEDIDKLWQE